MIMADEDWAFSWWQTLFEIVIKFYLIWFAQLLIRKMRQLEVKELAWGRQASKWQLWGADSGGLNSEAHTLNQNAVWAPYRP